MIKDYTEAGANAVSYEGGRRCLEKELRELQYNERIELDFEGVSYAIAAFLNPVIGDLILAKGADIMQRVDLLNANEAIMQKVTMIIDDELLKREDMEGVILLKHCENH